MGVQIDTNIGKLKKTQNYCLVVGIFFMLSEFQLAWAKMHLAWFEIDLAYLPT